MSPLHDLRLLASFSPLIASIFAPTSTLLDIPALTENWIFKDGNRVPDHRANLILSGIGLAFNVIANALLIARFSASDKWWRKVTLLSIWCWFIKFVLALVNALVFGLMARRTQGDTYGEGFWCAIISLLTCSLILLLLLFHWLFGFDKSNEQPTAQQLHMRVAGRHFMLQNTFFIALVGILALFMSRLEDWTYLQGIYFSIVSFLTIGFGDFYPTKPVTQIVLFPFVVIGIAQFANLIGMIVTFFTERAASRVSKQRMKFEKERQEAEERACNEPDLMREIQFLHKLNQTEDRWKVMKNVVINLGCFLLFWLLGALIFSHTESWTFGQGLYFCYVFFFVIGYGDYAPISPAGRVVFIVYALIAVPIMTSFAVETVTHIFRKISESQLESRKADLGLSTEVDRPMANSNVSSSPSRPLTAGEDDDEKALPSDARRRLAEDERQTWVTPHAEFVSQGHEHIIKRLSRDDNSAANMEAKDRDEDKILTEYVLELAVELERRARRLLVGYMENGSSGQILLKADRNVQLRDVKALAKEAEKSGVSGGGMTDLMKKFIEEESELVASPHEMDEKQTLEEVRKYRESFASLLAAGSRLMKLKGEEQFLFERRQKRVEEQTQS